ncbi:MAG: M20/M25/M40 family metallo-hydrolase [Symbiobacteriaceae bacterium]|nr:M20/M25/M40 family metallo-hydrolase [Symbiobacteriaceae bacterium]
MDNGHLGLKRERFGLKKGKDFSGMINLASLVTGAVIGMRQIRPPHLDVDSPYFPAYKRMMSNIARLATEPHPSGSEAIRTVQAELLTEITDMGLQPIVEDASLELEEYTEVITSRFRSSKEVWWEKNREKIASDHDIHSFSEYFHFRFHDVGADSLQNIMVKLQGVDANRGVLFVSHYDSVNTAPGAADDMLAVCAMLEALRAHAHSESLANDLYFLFTDGEERGLLGVYKFVEMHPELKDKIDMVINLEMRGNRGGFLLFETSPKAYQQLKTVVKAGVKPIGFSFAATIYGMMTNNTDFSMFRNAGYKGINFAVIEGVEHYHKATDSIENLNPDSAWQHLLTVLKLADYFAANPAEEAVGPPAEAVFFPFSPGKMVLIKQGVSQSIAAAIGAASLLYGAVHLKQKKLVISASSLCMSLMLMLTSASSKWMPSASYLFYSPLLALLLSSLTSKWKTLQRAIRSLAIIAVSMLWVPFAFLVSVALLQPSVLKFLAKYKILQ